MADDDIALRVSHLSKDFRLPHEKRNSLKEHFLKFGRPSFNYLHALHNINFEVKRGEFFGIVGRNGSGKSTLLKIIGGIYQPTKGSVEVNGTLTPFIELGIGFNPELTGRENIFLNGAILGLTRKEIVARYDEIVGFAELENFMDQKLKNYSSGMQVRLAFSIAIQAHNDVLLIDEVLAVGDANFQRKCFKVFREVKNSGKTIIFVTHAMSIVQEFCDRAMMIQDSEMVAIGEPRDIALRYELANSTNDASATAGDKLRRPPHPQIEITGIKLKTEDKKTTEFSIKDDIIAEVTVKVHKPVPAQFNLFFVRSDGMYVAGINSVRDLKKDNILPTGTHTLECTIKRGQLVQDDYSIGIGVYTLDDVPEIIDIVDKAYTNDAPRISLLETSPYQDGQFYIQGKWAEAN